MSATTTQHSNIPMSRKPKRQSSERMSEMLQSLDTRAGSVRVVSGSGYRYVVPFPWRLHQMLEETERKSLQGIDIEATTSIVSWLPDGLHFKVHDAKAFMARVVPRYFKQKSYKSFQRQLHIYGFKRVLKGPYRGGYCHPKFIKGDRKLTHEIDRIKGPRAGAAGKAKKQSKQAISISSIQPQQVRSPQRNQQDTITNGWLAGAGIATSDLNPLSLGGGHVQASPSRGLSKSLLACADEISFIFHDNDGLQKTVPSTATAAASLHQQHYPRQEEALFSTLINGTNAAHLNDNNSRHFASTGVPMNPLALSSSSTSSLQSSPDHSTTFANSTNLDSLMMLNGNHNFLFNNNSQNGGSATPRSYLPNNVTLDEDFFNLGNGPREMIKL